MGVFFLGGGGILLVNTCFWTGCSFFLKPVTYTFTASVMTGISKACASPTCFVANCPAICVKWGMNAAIVYWAVLKPHDNP